ncbi:deoxycytidine triphosphate deaminase [Mesorhizobium sp. M1027]|uniref:dCTP deaminase domain-containing protein n=1 Tax=Mesorhizobium sp. M1027 TaxID=2957050 RepID=UPI00333D4C57
MADNSTSPTEIYPAGGFWSDRTWKGLNPSTSPVRPFKQKQIDESNYLLSIGEEIYVSAPGGKSTVQKLQPNDRFSIDAGQFAFLLTEEEVIMPFNKIGFISIRATAKFWGLVNISGFHVDPGYKGKLIFAVFNAGPTRIHLKRGDQIFPIWIAALDQPATRTEHKIGYYEIPSKLINQISGEFTNAYQLAEKLKAAQEDIVQLKSFRVYTMAIIGVVLVLMSPFIKDAITRIYGTIKPQAVCVSGCQPSPPALPSHQSATP